MKKMMSLMILVILSNGNLLGQEAQDVQFTYWESPVGYSLSSIAIQPNGNINMVGANGTWLLKTPESDHFVLQQNLGWHLKKMVAIDDSIFYISGWASLGHGVIIKSVDAGLNWEWKRLDGHPVHDLVFWSDNDAIAVGDDGFIIKTSDGWESWTQVGAGVTESYLYCVDYLGNGVLLAGGDPYVMLRSIDYGESWTIVSDHVSEGRVYDMDHNNGTVFAALGGLLLQSNDNGQTWDEISNPNPNDYTMTLFMAGPTEIVTAGHDMHHSIDNGNSWQSYPTGISVLFNDIMKDQNGILWMVNYQGDIVSTDLVTAIIPTNSLSMPQQYSLEQNYPNPFNASTVISYELPEPALVSLTIFNQLGQPIRILVNDEKAAGYQAVVWDGLNNAGQQVGTGIYFYQLRAGNFNKTYKMILLK
ncbi:MAG: T9SS type A sorting domain-containing protein [Candidatus Komeilibacteria bacterium]